MSTGLASTAEGFRIRLALKLDMLGHFYDMATDDHQYD